MSLDLSERKREWHWEMDFPLGQRNWATCLTLAIHFDLLARRSREREILFRFSSTSREISADVVFVFKIAAASADVDYVRGR